jgi:hypothetical protein
MTQRPLPPSQAAVLPADVVVERAEVRERLVEGGRMSRRARILMERSASLRKD